MGRRYTLREREGVMECMTVYIGGFEMGNRKPTIPHFRNTRTVAIQLPEDRAKNIALI